ncbi:UDP-glucuronosyltransferase 2C1-like [Branchiostoma floridae]|uniref:UDP-glucuronosyltransferase n=1 Tax=Branchiostoma floridae TaxID=7739 RepID=A0A9J7HSI0_BRAFL|nr:UDP-glucuronosyltransferase 2C1-like [Branchiostoma floridae]
MANNMGVGSKSSTLLIVFLGLLVRHRTSGANVLLVPTPCGVSHWFTLANIGQALVRRGHATTVVVPEDIAEKRQTERPDFKFETFHDEGTHALVQQIDGNLHSNQDSETSVYQYANHGINLSKRVQNVVFATLLPMLGRWVASNTYGGLVRKYVGEKETIQSVVSKTDLWLYQTDHVLDFPGPSMPNMIQIGGLHIDAVSPLAEDLESFVQSAGDDGVIVVSLGTIVKTMSPEKTEIFAAAFARLRQKVVWRYTGEKPTGLGNNTMLLDWLPQNDLLGHPKTRAFITHAGINGAYEALHHGVPMVCLPLFFDQPGNAARVVARGLGVKLDLSAVTTDQLYEAITLVITNKSYRETAARLSRLHRDQPQSPMERAVWWIEHVIKHGGLPHLRARAVELPWYQYYLLDVAAFLLAVCTTVLGTVWCSCSLVCKKICCKTEGKLKSQ